MKVQPKNVTLRNGIQVTLRCAQPADAVGLLHHLRTTHQESYRNLNHPPSYWNEFSVEMEEKILADFESSESKIMLVAVISGSIVGALGLIGMLGDFLKHNANLGMSIQLGSCNSGLGTEMMNYALETGVSAGFKRITLTVRTFNEPGIALYERIGFQRIGLLKNAAFIDNQYVDEYSYQLILRPIGLHDGRPDKQLS